MTPVNANIKFDLAIAFTKDALNGEWIGHTQPFGMILRGKTKEDIQARLRRAADFFLTTICEERPFPESVDIRRYFDKHRIRRYDKHINHSIKINFPTPEVDVVETKSVDQRSKLEAELELAIA